MGPAIITQYRKFVKDVTEMHEADALLPLHERVMGKASAAAFWTSKQVSWPDLAPVGRWHTAFPIGALCCERAIGKLRAQEVPVRLGADEAMFARELRYKCNLWLLERALDARIAALRALQ